MYMIVLDAPNDGAWQAIRTHWADHLIADSRLAFVRAEHTVSRTVADQIGIGPDGARGNRNSDELLFWTHANACRRMDLKEQWLIGQTM